IRAHGLRVDHDLAVVAGFGAEDRGDADGGHQPLERNSYGIAGRRSSSLPTRVSAGRRCLQVTASAIVAMPPRTTAATGVSSAAAAPDSNAPSSFEALMKTFSTASTRPRSSSGVTIATVVARMFMLIMSTKPLTARASSESGSHL